MSSGIICKMKLEPFYQQFLRGYYRNVNPVFNFPRADGDELEIAQKLNHLLSPPPIDFKNKEYGENTFLVEVPILRSKDPFYNNYLSEKATEKLTNHIAKSFRFYFHTRMKEYHNLGFGYKESVELFMDENDIDPTYYSRCIKDLQRWRNIVHVKKYQQKSL